MPLRGGRPGLIGMAARTAVVAGTATAVSGHVARNQQERYERQAYEDQAYQQQAAVPAPTVSPEAMTTDEKIAKIRELGELKDAGLLSEQEFAAEKAKVLAL